MKLLEAWCRSDPGRSVEFRYDCEFGQWFAWLREVGSGCVGSGSGSTMRLAAVAAHKGWKRGQAETRADSRDDAGGAGGVSPSES